jgi:fatty-acid desaturase
MSQTSVLGTRIEKSASKDSVVQLKAKQASPVSNGGNKRQIWWSNAIFFIAFHIAGLSAWYYWPSSWRTWFLCYINWQIATLGITIGAFLIG